MDSNPHNTMPHDHSNISDTSTTYRGNLYCRKCGNNIHSCICTIDYCYSLKDFGKTPNLKAISQWNIPVQIRKRTPTSISGMKGITLLKRINKK